MMRKLCEKIGRFYEKIGRMKIISSEEYMIRYYLLFRGREDNGGNSNVRLYPFNMFLHNIRGSDEPVYHDHPWRYMTIILSGGYWEHIPIMDSAGYVIGDKKKWYGPGSIRIAKPEHYHWLEMGKTSTWTLFMRGKRVKDWGFLPFMHKDKILWRDWPNVREKLGFTR